MYSRFHRIYFAQMIYKCNTQQQQQQQCYSPVTSYIVCNDYMTLKSFKKGPASSIKQLDYEL